MKNIWVMPPTSGEETYWKEHGKDAWSRNIVDLMGCIKDGFRLKYCYNNNQTVGKWEDMESLNIGWGGQ